MLEIFVAGAFWAAALAHAPRRSSSVRWERCICERAGILNLGIEGIFAAARARRLPGGLSRFGTVDRRPGRGAGGRRHRFRARPAHRSARPVAAADGNRCHAAGRKSCRPDIRHLFGDSPQNIKAAAPIRLPGVSDLPFVGEALLQTPLTYLALVLVFVVAYLFARTPLGLAIRACGENPAAVAAQGRSVQHIRIGAVIAGSALMALGGATMSLVAGSFSPGMVNGRGFICLVLTTLAGWRTGLILILALLIGAIDAYQLRAQNVFALAPQLFLMVPFVVLIIALALTRTSRRPRALLVPYTKDRGVDRV